jgi:8-oxo-dGTP pyrophosphatase MutT (NUDIX family)
MPSVVTCILEHNNKILILKRSDNVRTYKRLWGGVGGYVEKNENPYETALKEIKEEVGVEHECINLVKKCDPVQFTDVYDHKTYDWKIYPFLFSLKKKVHIKIDWEHSEFRWISPFEIKKYNTVPHLKEIIEKIYE